MLFNSASFLLFFPVVTLLYFVIWQKARYLWLLAASYFFYMCWNPRYAILIAVSTLITYASGLLIQKAKQIPDAKKAVLMQKAWVVLSLALNLGILFFFKYYNFAINSLTSAFAALGIALQVPAFDVLLPVGISFYTFQALSYTIDVYRGDIYAEKNVFKYALFVSFFPQLVAGPIERSKNLLVQLDRPVEFDYSRVKNGLLRMCYGLFQKMVIADRVAVLVTEVFDNYTQYAGMQIAVAALFFAVQIYCDFGGYSNIAIGCAEVLGIKLMENFNQPYFASSIKDFWHRWHISLSSWFRDYLYFPLGGSRKGKMRTYLNTMIVFLASGLWHGANWTYVVWGALHGAMQIMESITAPMRQKFEAKHNLGENSKIYKAIKVIITFLIVDFAWIFFRANSISAALSIIKRLFTVPNFWALWDGSLYTIGLDTADFNLAIIAIALLFFVDWCRHKGICLRATLQKQVLPIRWVVYYAAIFSIIVFGAYGIGYDAAQFIYFQF